MLIKAKTSAGGFGSFVKVVVDINREVISAACELHIDCADELVGDGSKSSDLWGANVYTADKRIDFVSLINIRPDIGNKSMEILDAAIRAKVEAIIKKLLF